MAIEIQSGQRLFLVSLEVEAQEVHPRCRGLAEHLGQRPRGDEHVVRARPAPVGGIGVGGYFIRPGEVRLQVAESHEHRSAGSGGVHERAVEAARVDALPHATIVQLGDRLDQDAAPSPEALEKVGLALPEAVVYPCLDEVFRPRNPDTARDPRPADVSSASIRMPQRRVVADVALLGAPECLPAPIDAAKDRKIVGHSSACRLYIGPSLTGAAGLEPSYRPVPPSSRSLTHDRSSHVGRRNSRYLIAKVWPAGRSSTPRRIV